MKQSFLNQRNLTRRLRLLLVLFAMLLLPLGAWGQATITVAGYMSDANGVFSGVNIQKGEVSFYAPTNTLTLTDAVITGDIELSNTFDNFTIEVIGNNTLTGNITYTFPGGNGTYSTITFERGNNTQDCSLTIVCGEYPIAGFSNYLNPGLEGFSWYHESNTNVYTIATDYNLTVGGVAVTSANAADILDNGTTSTAPMVSYVASTNTLTLTGVTAAKTSYNGDYIVSNLATLNVNIVGQNEIWCTGAAFDSNYNGNSSLNFTTDETDIVNLYVYEYGTSYTEGTLSSGFTTITNNDVLERSNYYVKTIVYDLHVGSPDEAVTILNKDNITNNAIELGTDGKVSYDPDNHILTLKNATITSYGIQWSEDADLTIKLIGTSSINTKGTSNNCIIADSQTAPTITFTRDNTSTDPCSLELECEEGIGIDVIGGFSNSNTPTMGTGLTWVVETQDNNNNVTKASVAIDYGITVAGTKVTSANASEIKGQNIEATDPATTYKVSYAPDSKTLTLNNAKITGSITCSDDLTIHLTGDNYNFIQGESATNLLPTGISTTNPNATLTFTSDVDAQNNNAPTSKVLFPYVTTPIDGFSSSNIVYENGMALGEIYYYGYGDYYTGVGEIQYGITIGDIIVSSANCSPILNPDGSPTGASYDNTTHTFTLDGASLGSTVNWSVDDNLTIKLKGSNSITTTGTCITNFYDKVISFTRDNTSSDPCSLELSCDPGNNVITDSNGDYLAPSIDNDLYWYPTQDEQGKTSSAIVTSTEHYPLTIAGNQVTAANATTGITGTGITGTVTYNHSTKTLTLNGATIADEIIWDSTDDLTISVKGTNSITAPKGAATGVVCIRCTKNGTSNHLSFVRGDATNACELTLGCDEGRDVITGFANSNAPSTTGVYWVPTTDNKGAISSATVTTEAYDLWVAGKQVTEKNKDDVLDSKITTPPVVFSPATNTLTLNGVTIDNCPSTAIYSGLGDLTINIQGENTIAVSDTSSVIRSTNGGKLTITKTGVSPTLVLSNTRQSYYHAPAIKDFASFELAEGLYLSNTRAYVSDDYSAPAVYDTYINNYGGQTTMGLIDPTDMDKGSKGIRNVTISTDVNYPIWVAHHKEQVGNGSNMIYAQVNNTNKDDILEDDVPKVSFVPASGGNNNINTLRLNSATILSAIVTSLPNLTIEFSGENSLDKDGKVDGFIHGVANSELTFKAIADESEIQLYSANEYAVVEGFGDVKFIDAATQSNQTYDTTKRMYMYGNVPENSLTIVANATDYGVKVGGKSVNSLNYTNVLGDTKVSFETASSSNNNVNKLTLNGATITSDGIESNLDNLTIHLEGTNIINGATASISNGIKSTNENGKLTFTANGNASLDIKTSSKAISGFASVAFSDNTYLACSVPTQYNADQKTYLNQQGQNSNDLAASATKELTITTTATYPLWIGQPGYLYTQQNTNTLSLSGADYTNRFIVSGLSNLTITLEGTSKLLTNDSTCSVRSFNSDATLTFQKKDGATDCELSLSGAMVVKGFKSVSHEGLNFASKTGNSIDDASTKDAILTSATIYPLWVGGALVTSNNTSGTDPTNGNTVWQYNASNNTLTLTNYNKTDNDGHAFISNMANLNVYLVGTNTVSPGSGVSGVKAFYTTYQDATLTFSTDESNKGTLDASGYFTFDEGFRDDNPIYCNNGLGYFPSDGKIDAKYSPTITFMKRKQLGDTNPGSITDDIVGATETLAATYGNTFYAPKPTFNSGYYDLSDSTKYVYTYNIDGIVKFAEDGSDYGNTGKIPYGELKLLKAGTVTITCTFPGNMQNNPCSASYTLEVSKAYAPIEYNVAESYGYIDVDGNGQWGMPTGTGGTAPTLSKPDNITGTITYSSTNENVATISNTGVVTLLGMGSTTIKASFKDDDVYEDIDASYTLYVKVPATISFADATASMLNTEEKEPQTAIVNPSGATVEYSSSNTNVSVDADGKVTPDNTYVGKVTITATVTAVPDAKPQYYYVLPNDEHFKASYELTVSKEFNSVTFASGQSYATYCNDDEDDFTLPDGLECYAVKIPTSGNEVTLTPLNYIPGTQDRTRPIYSAVLLKRNDTSKTNFGAVTKYVRQSGDNIPDDSNNDLVFATADKNTDGNQYILYNGEFIKATGTITGPACYLESQGANFARSYVINSGEGGSMSIESIEQDSSENAKWFDLQGRRINKPTKAGLYLMNGKKMVINNK